MLLNSKKDLYFNSFLFYNHYTTPLHISNSMPPKPRYLCQSKSGTYYFRRRIPADIQAAFKGEKNWVEMYGTKDANKARGFAQLDAVKSEKEFAEARRGRLINQDDLRLLHIVSDWLNTEIGERLEAFGPEPPFDDLKELEQSLRLYLAGRKTDWKDPAPMETREFPRLMQIAIKEYENYGEREALKKQFPTLDDDLYLTMEAEASARKKMANLEFGVETLNINRSSSLKNVKSNPEEVDPLTDMDRTLLSELLEFYFQGGSITQKTKDEIRKTWRSFIETIGDIAIGDLRKAHLYKFQDLLRKKPKNISVLFRKLPLPKLVERVSNEPDITYINPASIQKALQLVKAVINWSEGRYIEISPARGIKAPKVDKIGGQKDRVKFSTADLKIIFNSPVYTGRKSAKTKHKPGSVILRDEYWWLPLLALFTGARIGELGKLLSDEVLIEQGIPILRIQASVLGRVKNKSSERDVPIHPMLVKLGFLDYAKNLQKTRGLQLFPNLKPNKYENLAQKFSRDWNERYLRKIGIKDPRKVFHSFRHLWKSQARSAGLEKALRDHINGHSSSDTAEEYGDWPLQKVYRELKKVTYPDLDLNHLILRKGKPVPSKQLTGKRQKRHIRSKRQK